MAETPPYEPERLKDQVPEELLKSLNLGFRRKKKRLNKDEASLATASKNNSQKKPIKTNKDQYKNFPKWLLKMKPFQILQLPYSELPYSHDFYEKALIILYKRHWNMFLIFLTHFLIISPVCWPPFFSYVDSISFARFVWRWAVLIAIPATLSYGLYWFLYYFKYTEVHQALTIILITTYTLTNIIGAYEDYGKWRKAYSSLAKKLKK